jgi:hypothetical protein
MEKEFGKKCITEETLEEASERLWLDSTLQLTSKNSFIQGAKWMQERMYSEEELEVAFFEGRENNLPFTEWFEKFKKK